MEAALAAADAFRIDDASCAVTQFWANLHETGFLHGHTYLFSLHMYFVQKAIHMNKHAVIK